MPLVKAIKKLFHHSDRTQWDSKISIVSLPPTKREFSEKEKEAISMWKFVYLSAALYEVEEDAEVKAILGAAFDDIYAEVSSDEYLMGVGRVAFNDANCAA